MTQRKRATGFALMDTAFAADAKFVRLSRKAKDPAAFAAAVGVYWMMLADARRNRSATVTWSDWDEYAVAIRDLKAAGLLIDSGFPEPSFDKWAPAYKSPWDAVRKGTQDDAEVREETQATPTSTLLSSTQLISSQPSENDAFIEACRLIGYIPKNDDFRAEVLELEAQYGPEPTIEAFSQAYARALHEGQRLKPFDLKNAAGQILAEQKHRADRANEAARAKARNDAALADVQRQEREAWQKCAECGELRRVHRADHPFAESAAA